MDPLIQNYLYYISVLCAIRSLIDSPHPIPWYLGPRGF